MNARATKSRRTMFGGRGVLRGRAAFSLVELLVVMVVIGVLIAMILGVGARVTNIQRGNVTRQTMSALTLGLEDFAKTNPLKSYYDNKRLRTFGPYPPYSLAGRPDNSSVAGAVEASGFPTLETRLFRDLGADMKKDKIGTWVRLAKGQDRDYTLDDNRALYTYLRLFKPEVLDQIPRNAIKPLAKVGEFVNPTGEGPEPGDAGSNWIDVLGIHDGWGVPLDYFLYVKLEYMPSPKTGAVAWRVTDRIPAFRSRGVDADAARAQAANTDATLRDGYAKNWIYSSSMPTPEAGGPYLNGLLDPVRTQFRDTGRFRSNQTLCNGWARAAAVREVGMDPKPEDYGYLP